MAKQEEDISIAISPSGSHLNNHQTDGNDGNDDNLEKQSTVSSIQAGVQRADLLRKSWTKQGLVVVFTGYDAWADACFSTNLHL